MSSTELHLHPPCYVPATATAREAAQRLEADHVGSLIVLEEGAPAGLVTDRDLALGVLREGLDPDEVKVRTLMSSPLVFLEQSASPREAARLMRRHRVRRLPVRSESGSVVGVVSADDLVRDLGLQLGRLGEAIQTGYRDEARPPAAEGSVFGRE